MHRLLKIVLLLNSVLILTGCSITKYNHLICNTKSSKLFINPVISSAAVSKYKASIDVLKNHLTGLIIVKQTDSITTHIVFVTELGLKMFDFEAKKDSLKAIYVFEPLKKPLFVEALKRNFSNMFLFNIKKHSFNECKNKHFSSILILNNIKETWFYSAKTDDASPTLQETFHKHKRTSKIEYVYDVNSKTCTRIKCKQYGLIKFYFELNAI